MDKKKKTSGKTKPELQSDEADEIKEIIQKKNIQNKVLKELIDHIQQLSEKERNKEKE